MMPSEQWLREHGCELTKGLDLLSQIYAMSRGNPCNGCNCKDTCPAWAEMKPQALTAPARFVNQSLCPKCRSPLNPVKVQRRGGKCACGQAV